MWPPPGSVEAAPEEWPSLGGAGGTTGGRKRAPAAPQRAPRPPDLLQHQANPDAQPFMQRGRVFPAAAMGRGPGWPARGPPFPPPIPGMHALGQPPPFPLAMAAPHMVPQHMGPPTLGQHHVHPIGLHAVAPGPQWPDAIGPPPPPSLRRPGANPFPPPLAGPRSPHAQPYLQLPGFPAQIPGPPAWPGPPLGGPTPPPPPLLPPLPALPCKVPGEVLAWLRDGGLDAMQVSGRLQSASCVMHL
jgi:hypothetical protein